MSTRPRRTDDPTAQFDREFLLQAAREADARARAAEDAPPASLPRPATIEILVDVVDVDAHDEAPADAQDDERTLTTRDPAHSSSALHEPGGLGRVPYLAVEREELPGFRLDKTAERVLAAIDGDSTVADVLARVRMPREKALEAIRAMVSCGVLGIHDPE